MKQLRNSLLLSGLIALAATPALGQPIIVVDEFGNSNILPHGQLLPDPTGGYAISNVLVFNLPFAGVPGDVLMHDGALTNAFLDVLRFDGAGHLIFYSDNVDGFDDPADTSAPPNPLLANQADIVEVGDEVFNYGDYFPGPNQPGFDPSGVGYRFVSDGQIPEPGSVALLLGGLGLLGVRRIRQKLVA